MTNRFPTALRSGALPAILFGLMTGAAPSALATPFTVTTGNTVTTGQTLDGADAGAVDDGGALAVNGTAVKWNSSTGSGPTLTNSGSITATGSGNRAIDMNFTAGGSGASFTLTNNAGAAITSEEKDGFRINKSIGAGTVIINNDGTIQAIGTGSNNGQGMDFSGNTTTTGTVTVNNRGTISSADADAFRPGNNATINNYGSITAGNASSPTGNASGNDGLDFKTNTGDTVNNYAGGSITGARHGITGKNAATITNWGTITGNDGSGINFDTTSNTPAMSVTNYGTITGNAVSADGDGIDIDRIATINNYGTVNAFGIVAGELSEAVTIGGGTINNYAGGTLYSVQRAITIDDSSGGNSFGLTNIYNEGTITGADGEAISITSTTADTLINKGTINGSVAMGAGDNAVTLYAGSSITGQLDGGAGTNSLTLAGTGSGAVSNVVNFATLAIDGGTWNVAGAQTYGAGITVGSAATMVISGTLGGDVTNGGTVAVNGGAAVFTGTFTNNGTFKTDPSTTTFAGDLVEGADGIQQSSPGDVIRIDGDFLNHSTQNAQWQTESAALEFSGALGTTHLMLLTGQDEGAIAPGYFQNFAWGALALDSGNLLELDSGLLPGADVALYVDEISGLLMSGDEITNVTGNGYNIYYDPYDSANAYLGGLTYQLAGGGRLIADSPEPSSLAALGGVLPALAYLVRRRKRRRA